MAWNLPIVANSRQPGSPPHSTPSSQRGTAELFPTASDLMIGRDGRLWVKRYARPREEMSWMAFGQRGNFSSHLVSP